ncbi:MAG TPA: hypothetical protein VF030_10360 [Solirubrobacterales bacterium]
MRSTVTSGQGRFGAAIGIVLATIAFLAAGVAPASAAYGPLSSFSGPGAGDGELNAPKRAAVEQSSGDLYVVDRGNDRVQVFATAGAGYAYSAQFGSAELNNPLGIAIDQTSGDVYVSDEAGVHRFDSSLAFDPTFSLPGVTGPLAFDSSDGSLVVADTATNTVRRFELDATPAGSFDGSSSPGGAFTGLQDIAATSTGDLIVIDTDGPIENQPDGEFASGQSRVERFDSSGAHEATIGPVFRAATVAVNPANDGFMVSGDQTAVNENRAPTLTYFDAANNLLDSFRLDPASGLYDTIHGLAADSSTGRFLAVSDQSYWQGCSPCYGDPGIHIFDQFTPPEATYQPPTDVTETSATLNGLVNPQGDPTTFRFEYTSNGLEFQSTGDQDVGNSGSADTPVSATIALDPSLEYAVRLVAAKAGGQITDVTPLVTLDGGVPAVAPEATLTAPTELVSDSMTLNGTVDPHGMPTTYRFEYSIDGGSEWRQAMGEDGTYETDDSAGAGDDPVAVSAAIGERGDIGPGQAVMVRLIATSLGGRVTTDAEDVQTPSEAPFATTFGAAPRTTTTARLNAWVNPRNEGTTYYFEWGPTAAYGQQSAPLSVGTGNAAEAVSEELSGLAPGATYHFRVVAENASGITISPDQAFTTRTTAETGPRKRGLELLNNPDKGNLPALPPGSGVAMASPDASKILWTTNGGAPGGTTGASNTFMAERTVTGWRSRNLVPPADQLIDRGEFSYQPLSASPGFDEFLYDVSANREVGTSSRAYVTVDLDYNQTLLGRTAPIEAAGARVWASDDLAHVYTHTPERHDPAHPFDPARPNDREQIYDFGQSPPELASVLPNGTPPDCGILNFVSDSEWGRTQYEWASTAPGAPARLFFSTRGELPCGVSKLYVRDLDADSTTLLSGPALPGGPQSEAGGFIRASDDGSTVLYAAKARLSPEDDNSVGDIYRYTLGGERECLTCVGPGAGLGVGPDVGGSFTVSNDLSRIYFVSPNRLLPGVGRTGANNLYLWHDGEIEYVAPLGSSGGLRELAEGDEVLFFGSDDPEISADVTGGYEQIYRYDEGERSIECVTCVAGRTPTAAPARSLAAANPVGRVGSSAEHGDAYVFLTHGPLDPRDINGESDVYEWRNGQVRLVTDGATQYPPGVYSRPMLIGVGNDGLNVMFTAGANFTGYERDLVGQYYVARVGGGFPPPPGQPAPCGEESCQGPLPPAPAPLAPGSASFQGPGNVKKPAKKRCAAKRGKAQGKKNRKGRCAKRAASRSEKKRGNR